MFDFVTIGSTTRDNFLEINAKTAAWPKTPSRRAYVLPLGEKLEVARVHFTIGGNSANAAVTFSRQGFRVACAAKIGSDLNGEEIINQLKREKVETRFLKKHSTMPTAYSTLLLESGERTILAYHGASDSFAMGDLRLNSLKSRWWYMSLAGESHRMFFPLLRFAQRNNIAVAFNPSGHHLRHKRNDVIRAIKDLSFLVLNDEEAALVTGIPWRKEREVFKKLDALTPGILAVTSGRGGVTVSDGKYVYRAGIFREKKLIDRTGAGDAFGSGFAAGLMRRKVACKGTCVVKPSDIVYAIRLATANATSVVENIGATEGTLTKKSFSSARWSKLKIIVTKI